MTSLTSPATGAVGEAVAVVPLGALAPERLLPSDRRGDPVAVSVARAAARLAHHPPLQFHHAQKQRRRRRRRRRVPVARRRHQPGAFRDELPHLGSVQETLVATAADRWWSWWQDAADGLGGGVALGRPVQVPVAVAAVGGMRRRSRATLAHNERVLRARRVAPREERLDGGVESAGAVLGQGEHDGARRDVVHQQAQLARAADPRGAVRLVVAPERYLAAGGEAERVLHRQVPAAPRAAPVARGCRMQQHPRQEQQCRRRAPHRSL